MKKAILIIVFGLLWCNVATPEFKIRSGHAMNLVIPLELQKIKINNGEIYEGMNAWHWEETVCNCDYGLRIFFNKTQSPFWTNSERYMIWILGGEIIYILEDPKTGNFSTKKLKKRVKLTKIFNLGSTSKNWNALKKYLKEKEGKVDWKSKWTRYDVIAHYDQISAKKIIEKKKKPEQSPDDDEVLAAASGTGFFVSRTGHIITNHHVIDECKVVKVNYTGNEIEAKILARDKTNDLAILQAKITPNKVYTVSNEDVSLLQDIIVAGFPLGKKVSAAIKTHKGSVSALAGFGDNYSNFQTDATINEGNSGGPVMDQKGNIVGVAVALMPVESGQNIFFAVKSSTLKTFASSNGLQFLPPNNRDLSNKVLGQLITDATVYLECWMTAAKIKELIAREENRKAFYSEYK